MQTAEKPIGIYDSGIGGLTVTQAITELLPNENIIYFGDTAHLPYGDKSTAAIQSYSIKICDFLLKQNCKIILIACNSASAASFDFVQQYVGNKAIVINVIDPVIAFLSENYANKTVGLIGTKKTVFSGVYTTKINKLNKNIELKSLATPLLAHSIEEGFFNNNISSTIIENYLSSKDLADIEALVLGCTHYPLIKKQISLFYKNNIKIIDSSTIVAQHVRTLLESSKLLNNSNLASNKQFFVSDFTHSFEASTKIFFNEKITLSHLPLWD